MTPAEHLYNVGNISIPYVERSGYYSGKRAWQQIPKAEADRLTHKEAYKIAGHMKRLGYYVNVEEVEE